MQQNGATVAEPLLDTPAIIGASAARLPSFQ
jgi:hypothetical protein